MKSLRSRVSLALVAVLFASLCLSAAAVAEPLNIDYVDGVLSIGENKLVLDLTKTPVIRLVVEGEELALYAQTTSGEMRVTLPNLEEYLISDTAWILLKEAVEEAEKAAEEAPVVYVTPAPVSAAAVSAPLCEACGESTATGDHTKLKCGHYFCLVGESHPTICSYCKRYTCNSLNHYAVCDICGNHVCTKAHRENCSAKASSTGAIVSADGKSFTIVSRNRSYYDGNPEKVKLLKQLERVSDRINYLDSKKNKTDEEKAELKALWKEHEELCILLYGRY